jgi:hypothetical protein
VEGVRVGVRVQECPTQFDRTGKPSKAHSKRGRVERADSKDPDYSPSGVHLAVKAISDHKPLLNWRVLVPDLCVHALLCMFALILHPSPDPKRVTERTAYYTYVNGWYHCGVTRAVQC